MDAIIYSSNTGYTEQYAKMLSEAIALPAYSIKQASSVKEGASVIYMGWICAGGVNGYKKARKLYDVKAVCGVGMAKSGVQLDDVIKTNQLEDKKAFTLQGGFDIKKLKGMYYFMMNMMAKTAGKKLAEKADRTPDEDEMLDLLQNGGNRVSMDNLQPVIDWCKANL